MWIVDTGPGSWRTLALRRIRGEAIGAIFYTHLHSDHIGELGEFNLQTWAAGRPGPLRVYGPDGVVDLVHGFAQAYAADTRFRIAHHGAALLPPDRAAMVPDARSSLDGADATRDRRRGRRRRDRVHGRVTIPSSPRSATGSTTAAGPSW